MRGRVIAIGDVHGCARALQALLDGLALRSDDTLVMLGDYVDRGPDGRGVIQLLLEAARYCRLVPLLGNHEEMMLAVLLRRAAPEAWLRVGGSRTLDSYGFNGDLSIIPPAHVEFLQSCLAYYETPTHVFLHANYLPQVPLAEQPVRALRWWTLQEHLPAPHSSGKTAVLGHTPDRSGEILDLGYLKCVDTYCYGGGYLTALDVHAGQLWQVDRHGQRRRT